MQKTPDNCSQGACGHMVVAQSQEAYNCVVQFSRTLSVAPAPNTDLYEQAT